jgi:hypothetical protein
MSLEKAPLHTGRSVKDVSEQYVKDETEHIQCLRLARSEAERASSGMCVRQKGAI